MGLDMQVRFLSILALVLASTFVFAEPPIRLQVTKKGTLVNLERVMVPSALSMAIGEGAGWLAFAHEKTYPEAHVSVVRLDAKGTPSSHVIPIKLPKPAGLAKHINQAMSVSLHPKLPILYVWQEIHVPYTVPPSNEPPELDKFDHLVIYDLSKGTPELLASLCRGSNYPYGCLAGGLQVDRAAEFLYVPNVRDPANAGVFKAGRFALDELGLPKLEDKDAQLPPAARAKRLVELNAAKPLVPHQATPQEHIYLIPFNAVGGGYSFWPVSREAVIMTVWNGIVSWCPEDKRSTLSGLSLRGSGHRTLSGHPHLPVVYVLQTNSDTFYRIEHGDGYPSQLPVTYIVPDVQLFGTPAVFAKGRKLALGSRYRTLIADLDDEGRCRPELTEIPLNNPATMALAYSERFDRLYVTVEISK